MITPGAYNITAYQDATWRKFFRLTQQVKQVDGVSIATGTPTFEKVCHDYQAGDRVVFTADNAETPLCGLALNTVYYVISAGLTADEFQVSATNGGASIVVSGAVSGSLYVAQPIDLAGYTVDADIFTASQPFKVATFTATVVEPEDGGIEMVIPSAVLRKIMPGDYKYDASIISQSAEKYYWLTGAFSVLQTYSRV
jgi:hypothetical protein